ncbi:MAG: UDP-glucose dehydrogenase family protein [Aggregatilineales bacterium]
MKICVVGLWHLGTVTAACLASIGHQVAGLDFDAEVIQKLQAGEPPMFEPGLEALVKEGLKTGALTFTTDAAIVMNAEVVWITYDTPVDDNDQANVDFVIECTKRLFSSLNRGTLVLISSQLPVGTTHRLEAEYTASFPDKPVSFAYSPENLRLGKAISVFLHPDRIVVGVRRSIDREQLGVLLGSIADRLEWMSVESAEMTKHAINAFLALSVTFANEIATLCESVGADAKEVERGLKSEARIGPKAYLSPGAAFAGGTLARDVQFLIGMGLERHRPVHLLKAIQISNEVHKGWARHKLVEVLGSLSGKTIAIWGLTYKPGTDTLRRSSAVELCRYLTEQDAVVQAHDPAVHSLPTELADKVTMCPTPLNALQNASALVLATEWPAYQNLSPEAICSRMLTPVIIDAGRFLMDTLGNDSRIHYLAIGKN